jgi:acyl-CoA synthetase (AMP-forming)/AMP-acid ligase II
VRRANPACCPGAQSPPLWLASASHYRATHLQAPNFAYKLTVRKYKALAAPPALDLRSVVHIFDAAEPVDPDAIDLFLATFAPSGLRREALVPGYGLAEHTVCVAAPLGPARTHELAAHRRAADMCATEGDRG